MIARERITRWAELAAAATEGPWVAEYSCAQRDCVVPHDAESTMEAVAVTRLLRAGNDAAHIAASRAAVPAMADALIAVLGIHKPAPGIESRNGRPVCDHCGEPDGWASEWPCPTVEAIETALGATP